MTPKQILLIDDEELIRISTQVCLELTSPWKVITASSGREGLVLAESQQPDAILLDVSMPDLDGLATFQLLQENPRTEHIAVLLLTARVQAADRRQLEGLGVKAVITKPYDPHRLATQIAASMGWDL